MTNSDLAESKESTLSIPVPKEFYMSIIFETCQFNLPLLSPVVKEDFTMAFSALLAAAKLDHSYHVHPVTVYRLLFFSVAVVFYIFMFKECYTIHFHLSSSLPFLKIVTLLFQISSQAMLSSSGSYFLLCFFVNEQSNLLLCSFHNNKISFPCKSQWCWYLSSSEVYFNICFWQYPRCTNATDIQGQLNFSGSHTVIFKLMWTVRLLPMTLECLLPWLQKDKSLSLVSISYLSLQISRCRNRKWSKSKLKLHSNLVAQHLSVLGLPGPWPLTLHYKTIDNFILGKKIVWKEKVFQSKFKNLTFLLIFSSLLKSF